MASQFADLYEKVDGTNSFAVLLDIAQGRTPRFTRRQGQYGFAASCVLRSFEDYLVAALPSDADLERLARLYPDIRVELHATVGRKLSDEFQDGKSYRYGVVNLGGRDLADVLEQFAACRVAPRHRAGSPREREHRKTAECISRSARRTNRVVSALAPYQLPLTVLLDPIREGRHAGINSGEQRVAALRAPASPSPPPTICDWQRDISVSLERASAISSRATGDKQGAAAGL